MSIFLLNMKQVQLNCGHNKFKKRKEKRKRKKIKEYTLNNIIKTHRPYESSIFEHELRNCNKWYVT